MSTGDIIVGVIIIGLVAMAILALFRGRMKGTSACGCDCGCCNGCSSKPITDQQISEKKE